MFIRNSTKTLNPNRIYLCGKVIGKYLIKHQIPLLSRYDKKMAFANTEELQKEMKNIPFYLRFLLKAGVIDG